MGPLRQLLRAIFGGPPLPAAEEHAPASPAPEIPAVDLSGPLVDDCSYRGPGVYYLYLEGELAPVYVGKSKDVRHRLRWHRYHLQQGEYPENPPVERIRWEVLRFTSEPEAWQFEQQEIRRLNPRWNGTGMSRKAIKARKAA
jgi:predicted GIY-YIG superfamily endonuclease